tara:strand:- start:439 stop:933 length:495 start_codon:yes stop_codon:yes gene_type:complete
MTNKNKFFAELKKPHNLEKFELTADSKKLAKANKIALSLISDIDDEYNWLEQSYSEASYGVSFMEEWIDKIMDFNSELSIAVDNYVVNGAAYSFQEAADRMKTRIQDLEASAEELGINPDTLVANYQEIKDILSSADSVDSEFRESYKELLRQANERFGLANFS